MIMSTKAELELELAELRKQLGTFDGANSQTAQPVDTVVPIESVALHTNNSVSANENANTAEIIFRPSTARAVAMFNNIKLKFISASQNSWQCRLIVLRNGGTFSVYARREDVLLAGIRPNDVIDVLAEETESKQHPGQYYWNANAVAKSE